MAKRTRIDDERRQEETLVHVKADYISFFFLSFLTLVDKPSADPVQQLSKYQ